MRLSELMNGNGATHEVDILGLSADSREVKPGYLFAALSGSLEDGADFIDDAIRHGAVAVLAQPEVASRCTQNAVRRDVEVVPDFNPRRRLAQMAARFYPAQPETVVAVTGTNGKTSVVSFARQIWEHLGYRAASLGTAGITGSHLDVRLSHTTPEPIELHRLIDSMATEGVDHLAIEASSHGLDQYRLDGVRVTAAAFTNLTRDHLDYHRNADSYLYAKLRLFGEVMAPGGIAVLNADDPAYADFEDICWARGHRIVSVGAKGSDLQLVKRAPGDDFQQLAIVWRGTRYAVKLPLIGDFQVSNALVAAALVLSNGADTAQVFDALEHLAGPPGRMELVARRVSGARVFVDYAHTPDALDRLLRALRPFASGELSVIFGCGGDRDIGKRPQMGRIASELADRVIITDDNPRNEEPQNIRRQISAAAPGAMDISDRAQAIRVGVSRLSTGDILVVAGKGHESGQIVHGVFNPFDDAQEVRDAIAELEENIK
jgi:UDP-N-acetylmuramoyl-L-alanyl-D-glutamate--2,6-diaminopimelate ligase